MSLEDRLRLIEGGGVCRGEWKNNGGLTFYN